MLDGVSRQLRVTISHVDFAKDPPVVGVLHSVLETIDELISHYTAKGDRGGAPTSIVRSSSDGPDSDAHYVSADTTAQPAPDTGGGEQR